MSRKFRTIPSNSEINQIKNTDYCIEVVKDSLIQLYKIDPFIKEVTMKACDSFKDYRRDSMDLITKIEIIVPHLEEIDQDYMNETLKGFVTNQPYLTTLLNVGIKEAFLIQVMSSNTAIRYIETYDHNGNGRVFIDTMEG